jgi:hypothetical protein
MHKNHDQTRRVILWCGTVDAGEVAGAHPKCAILTLSPRPVKPGWRPWPTTSRTFGMCWRIPERVICAYALGVQSEIRNVTPDQKLIQLCHGIGTERDPKKLMSLIEQLITLLHQEQDAIREKIRQRLSKAVAGPF